MSFKISINFFLICLILSSCSEKHLNDFSSAKDFTMKSLLISEGKNKILEMKGIEKSELDPNLLKDKKELVEEEDILNIELFHPKRKDLIENIKSISSANGFLVKESKIFIPNFGFVNVEGLVLLEVKKKLEDLFKEIKDIEFFVSFKKRKKKKIFVTGATSLEIEIDHKTRLFDVLSKAKLPPNVNFFKSYILRKNNFLPVDLNKLIRCGDMTQNILVEENDKIFVEGNSNEKIYVLGEVLKPTSIKIDGKISLKEVLAEVGGFTPAADKSFIQVFRSDVKEAKIYLLSWDYVTKMPQNCLYLIEGDIVYIASKPIVDWNRFVSQILPTISIIDSAYRGFKNMGIMIDGK